MSEVASQSLTVSQQTLLLKPSTWTPTMMEEGVRWLGKWLGLALVVAVGVGVFLWSQDKPMVTLGEGWTLEESAPVVQWLEEQKVAYELNEQTGEIRVPRELAPRLKMQLAMEGMTGKQQLGFEGLQNMPAMGSSQFLEQARYQHMLETELARTVMTLAPIKHARVHLAVGKSSAFVRQQLPSRASVTVELRLGQKLSSDHVTAIQQLVANSVANMDPSTVAVVDHRGTWLSPQHSSEALEKESLLARQQEIELRLQEKVVDVMSPILGGHDRVRPQITVVLSTRKRSEAQALVGPGDPLVRQERIHRESQTATDPAAPPGATPNTPLPLDPTASQQAGNEQSKEVAERSFEMDKKWIHEEEQAGSLEKIHAAIVLDQKLVAGPDGALVPTPFTDNEMTEIRGLIGSALGIDAERGDTLSVMQTAFTPLPVVEEPTVDWWMQPWVWDAARLAFGLLVLVFVIFKLVRPTLLALLSPSSSSPPVVSKVEEVNDNEDVDALLSASSPSVPVPPVNTHEQMVAQVRSSVSENPKKVANVLRTWVQDAA